MHAGGRGKGASPARRMLACAACRRVRFAPHGKVGVVSGVSRQNLVVHAVSRQNLPDLAVSTRFTVFSPVVRRIWPLPAEIYGSGLFQMDLRGHGLSMGFPPVFRRSLPPDLAR